MSRPPGVLLPILQETDWTGQTLAVVRPLVGFEGAHVPWVSFAYTDAQRRYTVTPSALEDEGRSKEALEWEALAQLTRRPAEWEVRARRGDGWPLALTIVDEFASSFVLDAGRLREGHKRLGTDDAWVAIPTQGVLVMRAREADAADALRGARELEAWARDAFTRSFDTRVTPTVFAVTAGVLSAALEPAPPAPPDETSVLEPAPYDADERRMGFFHRAGSRALTAADLVLPVEIDRRGRLSPGQPVDEVFVAFDDGHDADAFGPLVSELGLVVLVKNGAGFEEWDPGE